LGAVAHTSSLATAEDKVRGWLEPRSLRPAWATASLNLKTNPKRRGWRGAHL
jgi:hypothetical protein